MQFEGVIKKALATKAAMKGWGREKWECLVKQSTTMKITFLPTEGDSP